LSRRHRSGVGWLACGSGLAIASLATRPAAVAIHRIAVLQALSNERA